MIGLFGPALGGMLAEVNLPLTFQYELFIFDAFSVPFFAAGILAFLSLSITIIWLKEPQTPNDDRKSIPLTKAFQGIMMRRSFRILLYFSFLVQFAMSLFEGTLALHGKEVIGFGPAEMGLVLIVCGLVMAVAQGGVVSWLIDRIHQRWLLLAGLILMGMALILLMIPRTLILILTFTAAFGLGMAFFIPILATMVSRCSVTGVGAGLGMQNAVNSLGQALGPLAGGLLFTLSIHLPYLLAGILLLGSTGLLKMPIWGKTNEELESPNT